MASVLGDKCLKWQTSWVAKVPCGHCPEWQMSWMTNVLDGKCLGWPMSWVGNVSGGKCLGWEVVRMANVLGDICFVQSRVASVLEAIGYECKGYTRQKFQWQRCFWQY